MLQPATIKFLQQLKKNNSKEWFDKNRPAFEAAKKDFAAFVGTLIDAHGKTDPEIAALESKDCVFRINRDVRFSKDKSPYKTNMGASINRGGKKSIFAGYYFHLEPGGSFAGGGIWMPDPNDLKKIRQEIDYNYEEFKQITGSKKFKASFGTLDESEEYKLSRPPKGYDEKNAAIEFLKLKSFVAMIKIGDEDLTTKALQKKATDAFAAIQPLIYFINKAIEA
ncbi:MAG: DUF2461 domain-containing protein [Chitinophagaceae bacterium]|nr:DUF2461 domain-containing protein [Chitinophagaceae bacterium]